MFKKFTLSESISNQNNVKSSVLRSVRAKLIESYPKIEPYLDTILPKKPPVVLVKCKDAIQILTVDDVPVFFNHFDGPWMPTLRLLAQYPFIMSPVRVDRGAIKFVLSGANIMCPGMTTPGGWLPTDEEGYPEGTPVAIFAEDKEHPLAVGILTMSTQDIRKVNKGIGVENIHHLDDPFWKITKF